MHVQPDAPFPLPTSLGSDPARVDAHSIQPEEFDELPELTDDMLARAVVNKGGRPRAQPPAEDPQPGGRG
jgi:hypothetical protein